MYTKELKGVNRLFSDTNEGVNVLYREKGSEYGALLWTVTDSYGSVEATVVTLFGCLSEELTKVDLILDGFNGGGMFRVDGEEMDEFDNIEKGEEMATRYIRECLNEDFFVK